LQGYNKDTAYRELGLDQELVMQMRRSYDVRPPRMDDDHPYWHGNDRRYKKLSREQLESSRAESLKDTADRIMPFYESVIASALRSGNKCLVVSHANTIRTLIKNIDGISDEDIKGMSIPVSQNHLLLGTRGLCLVIAYFRLLFLTFCYVHVWFILLDWYSITVPS
jgi:2,3-bisphosphoglycerate-dependent phosphoglycerate mutase